MRVGIGLPSAIPGAGRPEVVDWARAAEACGFSTLAVLDRVAFPNLEPLACLAAAAAVTERIGLMTNVLLAPLVTNLGKRASTLAAIAGPGRFTLGVGVGSRREDYEASGVEFRRRGTILDAQLAALPVGANGPVHDVAGPAHDVAGAAHGVAGRLYSVLVGGRSDAAFRRAARFGDGWAAGGGDPARFAEGLSKLLAVWERDVPPRTTALTYFALDGDRSALDAYYAYSGSGAPWAATTAEEVEDVLEGFAQAGADEVILFPASRDIGQVTLLAGIAL